MARAKTELTAVAFDLDGLMFNTEELYNEVGATLLKRRGKRVTEDLLDQMMGRPSPVALQIMIDWHALDDTIEDLQNETDEIFGQFLNKRLRPMPGLIRLLAALDRAGIPKAIATSSRRAFVDRVLGISKLADRFDFFLASEDVIDGKPAPEIYLKAAERFGTDASRMMVLEDSENGCRAAVAANAYTVAVPGKHSRRHDFTGAALVVNQLSDPRVFQALDLE